MSSKEGEVSIVHCGTSAGPITLEFHRDWSPHGYDRAVALFERGFFDSTHFFRVVPDFLVQFGITYSTSEELKKFANTPIPDDPQLDPKIKFEEGIISYAGSGDNSRTSQLFISYGSNPGLGTQKWETPIGYVKEGMENVRNFYSYGDMPPWGKGPVQGKIHSGRSYIEDNFPLTDKFLDCHVERQGADHYHEEDEEQDEEEESSFEEVTSKNLQGDMDQTKQQQHHVLGDKAMDPNSLVSERQMVGGDNSSSPIVFVAAFGVILLAVIVVFALGGRMFRKKSSKTH